MDGIDNATTRHAERRAETTTAVEEVVSSSSLLSLSSGRPMMKHPKLFGTLVVAHFALACGGFIPAILTFLREGKWYLNPIKQPKEWANEHHSAMKAHTYISLLWILIAFLQYVVTPQLLLRSSSSTTAIATAKMFHKAIGYTAASLLVMFAINANLLTIQNGVSGLVLYNFLALITGSMMMFHLVRGIRYIRRKAIRHHIHEMCGLLSWTCFPGFIRAVAVIPYQVFLYGGSAAESCDVMNTSGMMAGTFPIVMIGLAFLKYTATHEPFRHRDYIHFYVLISADILIGLLGGTLFQCYNNRGGEEYALLQQVPGKPWTLQRWHHDQQQEPYCSSNTTTNNIGSGSSWDSYLDRNNIMSSSGLCDAVSY